LLTRHHHRGWRSRTPNSPSPRGPGRAAPPPDGRGQRESRSGTQPPAECKHPEPKAAASSGATNRCLWTSSEPGKGLERCIGAKHQLRLPSGLAASSSGDAAQTQQQLVTLRGWHHADQLGLTQPGSGLCEIQLAEPNETVDSFVERAITDCAERGQQTGSGVMDPQAGQIYDELRRRFRAD
jgi:hypothetical protein